jgi:signal-transduction protein with cAMP-binding, CBS, and nucleotidyltransferase domain
MFVEQLVVKARGRLVTIAEDGPLFEAARLLRSGADLVIVCGSSGFLAGVITKTDIVTQVSSVGEQISTIAASAAMTRDVVSCQPGDLLHDVWLRMNERGLKNIPVVDQTCRPIGVLHARDILQVLLKESEDDEAILRDYVMGIAYR